MAVSALLCLLSRPAGAGGLIPAGQATQVESLAQIMTDLAPQSAQDAAAIREVYAPFVAPLVLPGFPQIEEALAAGGLVPLQYPYAFNIAPRLDGLSPIAEKDLPNQARYLSARPATLGCLLTIGSRVKSGFVEVTSLVRHSEYQEALLKTNGNAFATIPTHTMGIAFDIGLVNTPIKTVMEIRDVLQKMRDDGDILFIGERHQLTFHVVPHPSRLGYFSDVYTRSTIDGPLFEMPLERPRELRPSVLAEIVGIRPTPPDALAWWAADNVPVDIAIRVAPDGTTIVDMPRALRGVEGAVLPSTPRAAGLFNILTSFVASIRAYLLT